ncbi:MAG TPA: hypothetical protein VMF62_12305 [Acetobacteraceae bacterium]|nr:hypothetical protein [Acetobacteraceae bacterium]
MSKISTAGSRLRKVYEIKEWPPLGHSGFAGPSMGREELYQRSDGSYWLRRRFYGRASPTGASDVAVEMTEAEARAWLKDRFGSWPSYRRLPERVFGSSEEGGFLCFERWSAPRRAAFEADLKTQYEAERAAHEEIAVAREVA